MASEFLSAYSLADKAEVLSKAPAQLSALKEVIEASGIPSGANKATGSLLFSIATSIPDNRRSGRTLVAKLLGEGKYKTNAQVTAAVAFVKKVPVNAEVDVSELERASGAGVFITEDDINQKADEVIEKYREQLLSERYLVPLTSLIAEFKVGNWVWADGKAVKDALDSRILALLGPRTEEDDKRDAEAKLAKKSASKAAGKAEAKAAAVSTPSVETKVETSESVFDGRELSSAINSPALIAEHLKVTGGITRTRFPPEPNGFLHIGHAKSMNLNFDLAFRLANVPRGHTIFRYDDTNPEAESQEYIDNQAENVSWMGWKPYMVTHSSDYFDQLHEFALTLIKKGKAYVCHQTKEELEKSREAARARDGRDPNSPWRNRSVEENLIEFEKMRLGRYNEGEAVLRLKIDMTHPNPTLWDPVAYRIKNTPHPHVGNKWCIYPAYDFTHCIVDSLEHIDFSLCTLEFEVRRDLYYWTLEQLDLWRPRVWEFARLNIQHVQLSKRKILKLVNEKKVRGWDDPRIPTINGLRRRGYTAEAINAFCSDIGVTRNDDQQVDFRKLEFHLRSHLDTIARRNFLVLKPLKITLTNVPDDFHRVLHAPDFPRDASLGQHTLPMTKEVYIDADDFRMIDSSDFFGLAPGKTAGLRYGGYVTVTDVQQDAEGNVVGLLATYDEHRERKEKVKGNLHWVSASAPGEAPTTCEVRLYDHLFTTTTPGETGDWESEVNPNSEVIQTALINPSLLEKGSVQNLDKFQFERVGYFVADKDSDFENGKLVFNLTVGLKENTEVKKVKEKC